MMLYLLGVIDLILAALGAWAIIRWAKSLGLMDHPNHRSSHQAPTPKGGGVGILVALMISAVWVGIPLVIWLPQIMVGLLAFVNDRYEIEPKLRLAAQFFLALVVLVGATGSPVRIWDWLLLVWWCIFVVVTTNTYNFMDGINGLSALTGVVGFGLCAYYLNYFLECAGYAIVAYSLCVSSLGFLPFNFPKAKVFMGDVGSILLGFTFGTLVAITAESLLDVVCMISFLFTFYADEVLTIAVRICKKENILQAHRSHLYQLIANQMSQPHWKVTIFFVVIQFVIGLSALLLRRFGPVAVILLLCLSFSVFTVVSIFVRRRIAIEIVEG